MLSRSRAIVLLAVLTLLLFQSHWVDDFGTGDRDVAGIAVSAVASILLATGLLLRRRVVGVVVLVLAFLFVALVSAADLRGVDTAGGLARDVVAHWRDGLGWGYTVAVALTLLLSVAGTVVVIANARRGAVPPSNR